MSGGRLLRDLKDYIFRFKDYLISERKLSDNTLESYYSDVMQYYDFISESGKPGSVEDCFQLDLFDEFMIVLYNRGLKNSSISRKISSLSLFTRFLKIEGIIKENLSYLINRPKTGDTLPRYLTVDEIEKFLNTFDTARPTGIRDRTLFELMYSCGLRVSEVSGLDLADIYPREKLLRVLGKGTKERYVPVGQQAAKELNHYLLNGRPFLEKKHKKNYCLFLNFRGDRLSRKGIWKNLKKAAAVSGINKNFSVHTLRHSFATHLVQNGADIRGVQMLLGHKNINTTEIYTHLNLDHIRKIYNKFHHHGSK